MLFREFTTSRALQSCMISAAVLLMPNLCLAGQPTVTFKKIVWEDVDPFPGRPGDTYRTITSGGFDAEGNLTLIGQSSGIAAPFSTDLLLFHRESDQVVSIQQGFSTHPDLPDNLLLVLSQAIRNQSGAMTSHWSLLPQVSGAPSRAFFLTSNTNQNLLAAHNNLPVPGQPPGTPFTALGFVQNLVMRFNDAGTLVVRGSFQLGSEDHLGLYRLDNGQALTRIYDTTMRVPGHLSARWVPFQVHAPDWPFDSINTMQLADTGDVFWQGLITEGSSIAYPALFRQAADGEVSHILGGPRGTVPDQPSDVTFRDITGFLANATGTVAVAAQMNDAGLHMGIYAAEAGQQFEKIHDFTDPIPGIPEASGFSIHKLSGLNDRGDIVYSGAFHGPPSWPNGGGGSAVVLQPMDGPKETVFRYDQLPDQPSGAFMNVSNAAARINNRGDIIVSGAITNGTSNKAVYMYLRDRRELVTALVPGTVIDDMSLFNWDFIGWTNYGGGTVEFRDDRSFVARLLLAGPDQIPLTSDDIKGLYIVQVEADLLGDMNCDGTIDGRDVIGFTTALTDPDGFPLLFPDCDANNADVNRDGELTHEDVVGFVSLLIPSTTR